MSEHENGGPVGLPRKQDPYGAGADAEGRPRAKTNGYGECDRTRVHSVARGGGVDAWTIIDLLMKRWYWLLLGTAIGGVGFCALGWYLVKPKFTATAQILRQETPGKSDFFKTTPISAETFAGLIRSPEILQQVGDKLSPPVPPYLLNKWIKIDPEPDSDLVKISASARTPDYAVNLVNLYSSNAVWYLTEDDARKAAVIADDYLKKQLVKMDAQITEIEDRFRKMPVSGLRTNGLSRERLDQMSSEAAVSARRSVAGFGAVAQRLQTATQELNDLLSKFTEEHPSVMAKKQYIEELKKQMETASTNGITADFSLPLAATGRSDGNNPDIDIIFIKLRSLEDAKVDLQKRMEEAQLLALNKPASVRVFAPAEIKTLKGNLRRVKLGLAGIFGAMLGFLGSMGLVMLLEFLDNRLKTPEDIARVTRLPVLTTLGDLRLMKPEDRTQWAFRAWTMLQGRLSPSANHGLICGVTSAKAGEGRSTWISLLAEAAILTGYRVLTVATRPSTTHLGAPDEFANDLGVEMDQHEPNLKGHGENGHSAAVVSNVLTTPQKITEELTRPNSQPVVHIPLPGWVWNLERRNQWREALREWNQTENLVILVELPPADVPEAVLLGSNLPNMIWLTNSGAADAAETRAHLETLRHARCHLVGAVLNRAPNGSLKSRFPRWLGIAAAISTVALGQSYADDAQAPASSNAAQPPSNAVVPANAPAATAPDAAVPDDSAPQTNRTFSIVKPSQRAAWQDRLTLGPGDVFTLNLYGAPELTRAEVAIGPDGRVSYLEAQDVMASGLTIDELRSKLDQELGRFRRAPRTLITPVAFHSKKYYMLGKVATKGVYVLDRPLTLLEALARAHGFESALVDRNIYDLADYQHSFLAREGKRIPLNFERLFQQGDLTQNIAIEPGDYIYFAGTDVNEVYVVGEVRSPGPVTFRTDLTIIGAIAGRGGYTERAYKAKVVLVRGSLSNQQKIIVDTHAILDARQQDFRVQPRDIIFVKSRPFIRVEELADLAATAFIQSVVTEAVGVDVVKPTNQ